MRLKDLRLAAKLGLGFGICIALTTFLGLFSTARLHTMDESFQQLKSDSLVAFQALSNMTRSATAIRALQNESLLTSDKNLRAEIRQRVNSELEKLNTSFSNYEKSIFVDEDRKLFGEMKEQWKACEATLSQAFAAGNSSAEAKTALVEKAGGFYAKFDAIMDKLVQWNDQRAEQLAENAEQTYRSSVVQTYATLIVCLLCALGACVTVTRSVTLPLSQVRERMAKIQSLCVTNLRAAIEALAKGNLIVEIKTGTTPVPYDSKDEIGQVATSFNALLDDVKHTVGSFEDARMNLRALIGDVSATAAQVANSSETLNSTADEANATSEEIAQTVQQVATAASESAETSGQIAKGSEQLAASATDASNAMEKLENAVQNVQLGSEEQQAATAKANEVAVEGGKAVQQTIASMERISKQVALSEQAVRELGDKQTQIGNIVQAIDEIAEQTNLLALNAAIEAARAGEHGRGFAVVAEEVRKLAERSSASTKEIADLIGMVREGVEKAIESMTASAEEVAEGSKSSDAAKAALTEILKGITEVQQLAENNGRLVSSMVEDAKTVTDSISSVASVSEETAAGAEEMSASSEEMAAATQQASAAVQQQVAGIGEVARMSGELKTASEKLQSLVSTFTFEDDAPTKGASHLKVAA